MGGQKRGFPPAGSPTETDEGQLAKACEWCGNLLEGRPSAVAVRRFCSRECWRLASRRPLPTCPTCGKGFYPARSHRDQLYGSRQCFSASRQVPLHEGICATCGTVFAVNRARIDLARFCSRACRYASQRDRIPCTCKMWGKPVLHTPSHLATVKTTYCSPACYMADPDLAARLVNMNVLQPQLYPNRLEQAGYALLDQLGIAYEPQYVIAGRFRVDAFVPTAKLAIQWAGDYWHGNPALFPEPDARQRRRRGLDKGQDAYLARCGYRVLRIWESAVAHDPEAVARRIAEALAGE